MSKLDFIKKLYNGKNCYSDHMNKDELGFLHISSGVVFHSPLSIFLRISPKHNNKMSASELFPGNTVPILHSSPARK